jgi:hypothetical protein
MTHIWRCLIDHYFYNQADFGLRCCSTKTVVVAATENTLFALHMSLDTVFPGDQIEVKQAEYIGELVQ